ncbi:MAG TPA: hypothetical protein VMW83_14225 [Spirochaetia bacterium]|nr:hypothetical protein [Spirochaetia bacterium]
MATYQAEPFKCWGKAKEIRQNYYRRFAEIKEITGGKGVRWGGGGWTFDALVKG